MDKKLKIAIIGSRGYPYVYSGYETFVKELANRLVKKNIEVIVYCHKGLYKEKPKKINGIELIYIPTIQSKSLSQFIHSLLSIVHFCFSDIQNHGLITVDKKNREKKLDNAHYFPVDSFWDQTKFFEQIRIIGEKFKLDLKLDDSSVAIHQEFISLLPQLKTRNRAKDIITAIKENKDIDIQGLDLVEEAYIYSWMETTHNNILAPFTNRFFATTKEIIDYIRWYPHFYHGINPTLPKNIG